MSMTERNQIHKCDLCGQIIAVVNPGSPSLVCCGQPMKHMAAGTSDGAKEKHVPVLEKTPNGCKVSVGSVPHPMLPEHFIEWVEVTSREGKQFTMFFKPGDAPECEFAMPFEDVAMVREYCNLHGLWKA